MTKGSPILSEAAAGLSRQLQDHLAAMAAQVGPYVPRLRRKFDLRLRAMGFTPSQRASLQEITPAAAALLLADGQPLGTFLEQVEYRGRRLAKLAVAPGSVRSALHEFDLLFESVPQDLARKRRGLEAANLRWVRDQLHFCAVLTLNHAFYQVREAESQAFYDLFRAEVEAPNLAAMIERFLETLKGYTGAPAARIAFFDKGAPAKSFARRRCFAIAGEPPEAVLDPDWRAMYHFCWNVPLIEAGDLRGALQFAFAEPYEWLPREQELLTAAAERCWRAAEKARLIHSLAQREEQIRRLAGHMVEVEEAERRRISRELHDEAGQSLLCVRLQLEMTEHDLPASSPAFPCQDIQRRLSDTRDLVDHSIVEIRRLIAALSPAVLDQMGLFAGLRQIVTRFRGLHPLTEVDLRLPRRLDLPKKVEIIVYRLVQECFNNISKYSAAHCVNLSVDSSDGYLSLHIEDDGVGFEVEEAFSRRDCFGLAGLRERVALLGGSLQVRSLKRASGDEPSKARARSTAEIGVDRPGTAISIRLPLDEDGGVRVGPDSELQVRRNKARPAAPGARGRAR